MASKFNRTWASQWHRNIESKCHYFHFFMASSFDWHGPLYTDNISISCEKQMRLFFYMTYKQAQIIIIFSFEFFAIVVWLQILYDISNEYHQFLKIQIISIAFSWKTKSWLIKMDKSLVWFLTCSIKMATIFKTLC